MTTLLSLIPKIGKAASGFVSGAVAGVLTTALGEAYIQIMSMIFKGEMTQDQLENESGQTMMNTIFKEECSRPAIWFV